MVTEKQENIYIVITQTGTILSRILKRITGADYNHVSLGVSKELDVMYSFGRKNPYCAFWGGFVVESRHFGTFKRFKNTEALVLELNVGEKRDEISKFVTEFESNKRKYHYNYLGLIFAYFKIFIKRKNYFYCSEFVRFVLEEFGINGAEKLPDIVQPMHFLNLPDIDTIYKGKLRDYTLVDTFEKI